MHLNWSNFILPMAMLVGLSVAMPAVLASATLSHQRLTVGILLTGVVVWAVGAGIMALLYARVNDGVSSGLWPNFERSGLLGLLWGPVLALVWLIRAQGIERRRGLRMGRGGDEAAD